jgi:transposase
VVAAEQDAAARAAWWDAGTELPAAQLVFIDESGTNTTASPRYGWAPRGHRAHGVAPRTYDHNTTLVAALTWNGIGAAMTLPGALDGLAVDVFLDEVLVPTLRPEQVLIMDNRSVHPREVVRARIEAVGCTRQLVPAYSLDFTPIEQAFSKLKPLLRRAEARTQDARDAAISAGLVQITATDAIGWFRYCGYDPTGQPL